MLQTSSNILDAFQAQFKYQWTPGLNESIVSPHGLIFDEDEATALPDASGPPPNNFLSIYVDLKQRLRQTGSNPIYQF